jgi:hypothetical protein
LRLLKRTERGSEFTFIYLITYNKFPAVPRPDEDHEKSKIKHNKLHGKTHEPLNKDRKKC